MDELLLTSVNSNTTIYDVYVPAYISINSIPIRVRGRLANNIICRVDRTACNSQAQDSDENDGGMSK